jgi:hypothetical protein
LDNDDLRYTPLNPVMSSAIASRIKTPVTPQLRPAPAIPPVIFARIFACPKIPLALWLPVCEIPRPAVPHFAGAVSGLGAAEGERHTLTEPEVEQIVRTEVAERQAAAYSYDRAGRPDQAGRLRREASILMSVIDRSAAP